MRYGRCASIPAASSSRASFASASFALMPAFGILVSVGIISIFFRTTWRLHELAELQLRGALEIEFWVPIFIATALPGANKQGDSHGGHYPFRRGFRRSAARLFR